MCLGEHQSKALKPASAQCCGNYLTTVGNKISDDLEMIQRMGLEI